MPFPLTDMECDPLWLDLAAMTLPYGKRLPRPANVISLEKAITIADKVMNKNDENIALSKKKPTFIATDKHYIRVQDTVLYGNSKRSAVRMAVESKEQNGGIQATSEIGR